MISPAVRDVRPFPRERLPRMSRAEALLLRRCARSLPLGALAGIAADATEWLGAPLELEPLPVQRRGSGELSAHLSDPICAAILETNPPADGARIAIEIEPRFAAIVVDRVLGGTAEDLPPDPGALGDVERGVLAYAVARALAASAPGSLRLATIVTSPAALAMALGRGPVVCWPARARLGAHVGAIRAWIPQAALDHTLATSTPGAHTESLGAISTTIVLEAGRASLLARELAELAPGDVIVLDDAPARPSEGTLRGEVVARIVRGAAEWRCAIDGDRFVVRATELGRPAARAASRGATMTTSDESNEDRAARLLRVVGDAPVELVVELARFEMPLSELAALRPGEVLGTGRAIGERIVLRAGERIVAHGELVEIEGEIGVRLISLAPHS